MSRNELGRTCPECNERLPAIAVRCPHCGHQMPEAGDIRSDPDAPRCGLCEAPMELMAQKCPSCGAFGYPALRPRQGRKCKTAGDMETLAPKHD